MNVRSFIVYPAMVVINLLQAAQQNPFVIGCRQTGLFSNFLAVLPTIAWCEKCNKVPVVYWDKTSLYYDATYTDTDNVWEYYFEPVSEVTYKAGMGQYRAYQSPDKMFIPWRKDEGCFDDTLRITYFDIVKRYIRLKPAVQAKIDAFYNKHMKKKLTIGIHLRGTDKKTEARPVSTKKILKKANQLAKILSKKGKECQFLVATDQQSLLDAAEQYLEWPVIHYNAYRSPSNAALHYQCDVSSRYKLGEDIIIETYLLAACDHFIHTRSNVSIAVCILNPDLSHTFLEN